MTQGPFIKEPMPEKDPALLPPAELVPILDILNHALLEPWGICQATEDQELLLSRLARARSWKLSFEPHHPFRDLIFRRSLEDQNHVWITRESTVQAQELEEAKKNLLTPGEEECNSTSTSGETSTILPTPTTKMED